MPGAVSVRAGITLYHTGSPLSIGRMHKNIEKILCILHKNKNLHIAQILDPGFVQYVEKFHFSTIFYNTCEHRYHYKYTYYLKQIYTPYINKVWGT